METLAAVALSALSGVVAWVVTNFFAKPILDFHELRRRVHEELIFSGNLIVPDNLDDPEVAARWRDDPERLRYEKAYDALRRYAAQLIALDVTMRDPAKSYLENSGYDMDKAARGLIGHSNLLARSEPGERAFTRNLIEVGLQLPRTYTDDDLRQIRETMEARSRRDA